MSNLFVYYSYESKPHPTGALETLKLKALSLEDTLNTTNEQRVELILVSYQENFFQQQELFWRVIVVTEWDSRTSS